MPDPYRFSIPHQELVIRVIVETPGVRPRVGIEEQGQPANVGFMLRPPSSLRLVGDSAPRSNLEESIAGFLEDLRLKGVSPSHFKHERDHLRHAAEQGGWKVLDDFSIDNVRKYLLAMRDRDCKAKTIKLHRDTLDRFGNWLVVNQKIQSNPVKAVPPPIVEKHQARVVPTEDEVRRIVAAGAADWRARDWWLAVYTMAISGLRVSECKGLTWSMLKLDQRPGWIDMPAKLTKSKKDQRAYLSPELRDLLLRHRAKEGARDRVFSTGLKREQMITYCRKAGVQRIRGETTLSYHSFRHFASNRMLRLGFGPEERQMGMRHANLATTSQIYTDSDPLQVSVLQRFADMPGLLHTGPAEKSGTEWVDNRDEDGQDGGAEAKPMSAATLQHDSTTGPATPQGGGLSNRAFIAAGPAASREKQGVAQLGSAAGLGPAGRRFESGRPDSQTSAASAPSRTGTMVQIHRPGFGGVSTQFQIGSSAWSDTQLGDGNRFAPANAGENSSSGGNSDPRAVNPARSDCDPVAQLEEHRPSKPAVPGSTPGGVVHKGVCQSARQPGCDPGNEGSIPSSLITPPSNTPAASSMTEGTHSVLPLVGGSAPFNQEGIKHVGQQAAGDGLVAGGIHLGGGPDRILVDHARDEGLPGVQRAQPGVCEAGVHGVVERRVGEARSGVASEVEIAARVLDRHPNRLAILAALLSALGIGALAAAEVFTISPAPPPERPIADVLIGGTR